MIDEPLFLLIGEKQVDLGAAQILIVQLLVIVFVFVLKPVHGRVQFDQEISAFFADREEKIRGTDFPDWFCVLSVPFNIHCDKGVELRAQQTKRFILRAGHFNDLRLYAVGPRPIAEQLALNAAFCNPHFFPI